MFGSNTHKSSDSGWWETLKIILEALAIAMVVRIFFYQPFNIPSGSMKKTLLVGDYLFVSKLSYGYSRFTFPQRLDIPLVNVSIPLMPTNLFQGRLFAAEPKRGDVVVFKLPRDNSTDYIKRVIGLPGDEIQMRSGVLYINGKDVPKRPNGFFTTREEEGGPPRKLAMFEETLPNGVKYNVLDSEPNGPFDNTGVFKVPAGHYFMMGDNRDNSTDSRASYGVGYVPFDNLIGKAQIIFFSAAVDEPDAFRLTRPWTWPFDIRWERFFKLVN